MSGTDQRDQKASASTHESSHVVNGIEHDHSHGHSVAAWTCVGVVVLGALIVCVGVVLTSLWISLVGAATIVIGGILGKVLSAMGFGVGGHARS